MTSEAIFETSEVAYDLSFELIDLDYPCFHVSIASNCHHSQDVPSLHMLLPFLKPCQEQEKKSNKKPCQEGPLTSVALLGRKNKRGWINRPVAACCQNCPNFGRHAWSHLVTVTFEF